MSELPPTELPPSKLPHAAELFADNPLPAQPSPVRPPITPAEGGWAAIIVLVTQKAVSAIALARGLPLGTALLLSFVVVVLVFSLTMRRTAHALLRDVRWRTRPQVGVVLGSFALAFVASRALLLFVLSLWPAGAQTVPEFLSKGADVWVLLLVAGFLIPVAEEVAFRGLLMRGFEWARGPVFAALVSSLLFGLAHGAPAQVIAILPLAWFLARSVQYSGSLWTSISIHILNNALAVGLSAFLQGKDLSALGGDITGVKIPLTLGLASLLVGVAALVIGTLWLTPRHAPAPQARFPRWPIWTLSTTLLGVLVLAAVALSSAPLIFKNLDFKGL